MQQNRLGNNLNISYFCESIGLLCCAFCFAGWIAQSEDDGTLVELPHVPQELVCERSTYCSSTDCNRRLQFGANIFQLCHVFEIFCEFNFLWSYWTTRSILKRNFFFNFSRALTVLLIKYRHSNQSTEANPANIRSLF